MRSVLSAAIAISLAWLSPAHAGSDALTTLPKTSNWEMRYDEDSCHLLATFGEGSQQVILRMTRFEPASKFDLMLYGEAFRSTEPWLSLTIAFGKSKPFTRPVGAGTSGERQFVIANSLRFDSTEGAYAKPNVEVSTRQEAAVDSITFSMSHGKSTRLVTESLAAPMEAMRTCTDDLIKSWGYDPTVYATLTRPPTPKNNPGTWVSDNDYPTGALMAGHNGIVQFRLQIDEAGKIVGCRILQSFKPGDFDKLTCELIGRRARFDPALDAAGKPIKWFYVNRVRWVMSGG